MAAQGLRKATQNQEHIDKKLHRLEAFNQIHWGSMICLAMSGSGCPIGGEKITIIIAQRIIQKAPVLVIPASIEVAHGDSTRGTCVAPIVPGTSRAFVTTTLAFASLSVKTC